MKQELQELITLTELFVYENYSISKKKLEPVIISAPIAKTNAIEAPVSAQLAKKQESPAPLPQPIFLEKIESDFSDIEKIFAKDLPHIKVHKELPLASTKQIAYILFFEESEKELRFLQNIAKSISCIYGPVSLLKADQLKNKNDLKFILISKKTLSKFPNIQTMQLPICIFNPPSEYFTNPLSKAKLWKDIVKICL